MARREQADVDEPSERGGDPLHENQPSRGSFPREDGPGHAQRSEMNFTSATSSGVEPRAGVILRGPRSEWEVVASSQGNHGRAGRSAVGCPLSVVVRSQHHFSPPGFTSDGVDKLGVAATAGEGTALKPVRVNAGAKHQRPNSRGEGRCDSRERPAPILTHSVNPHSLKLVSHVPVDGSVSVAIANRHTQSNEARRSGGQSLIPSLNTCRQRGKKSLASNTSRISVSCICRSSAPTEQGHV